jgi:hypothetical protein
VQVAQQPGVRLSRWGRRARTAAFLAGLALLLAGTAWGEDDHFPFGPFRMYATADDPNGQVHSPTLRAVDVDGTVVHVGEDDIGLRRAEYEGQLSEVVANPDVLGELAGVFARRHPDRPRWVEVQVVQRSYRLVDGVPGPVSETVLATWTAS